MTGDGLPGDAARLGDHRLLPEPHANRDGHPTPDAAVQGLTAGDYLAWAHDPDAQTLTREPRLLRVQADPLGNRIDVLLSWSIDPPPAQAAAAAAGFALTPEVIKLRTSSR